LPEDDPGDNAPGGLAVINLEYGYLPICYYDNPQSIESLQYLVNANLTDVEVIFEWKNPGVITVWEV
jgi:hypothetical protein